MFRVTIYQEMPIMQYGLGFKSHGITVCISSAGDPTVMVVRMSFKMEKKCVQEFAGIHNRP